MQTAEVFELPVRRHFAVDERGVGLRVTWRWNRGFTNLSLWRNDVCVDTFHLSPAQSADLIGFLASGLVAPAAPSAPTPAPAPDTVLEAVGGAPRAEPPPWRAVVAVARSHVARSLAVAAERLAP
ncbi:MAG TPA: hypothetical protein VHK88_01435 [Aquihabitans sp.]|nr:hypothetical protein [Aquihabitans sp.]